MNGSDSINAVLYVFVAWIISLYWLFQEERPIGRALATTLLWPLFLVVIIISEVVLFTKEVREKHE